MTVQTNRHLKVACDWHPTYAVRITAAMYRLGAPRCGVLDCCRPMKIDPELASRMVDHRYYLTGSAR